MIIDIVKREKISQKERMEMFAVFERYYENVVLDRFQKDLEAKNWVIQLRNQDRDIVGFSTIQTYMYSGSSVSAMVIFSGDTIVDRAYRTNGDLAGAFGHFLLRTIEQNKDMPVYWLLTSKGIRTYRFLPVFFKTFFPVFDKEIPENTKLILDEAAIDKFGSHYSPETQIISHHNKRDRLCVSELDPLLLKRQDSHIGFFIKRNPGYSKGDELACITEMSEKNLNSRAWRVIKHTEVNWRDTQAYSEK